MKNLCFSLTMFFAIVSASAQTIVEKKEIYSVPGKSLKVTNAYGAARVKGGPFDLTYSGMLDPIDLGDKGFLLRSKYTLILFDNNFQKIKEHDISQSFVDPKGTMIYFSVTDKGVWIYQGTDGTPKTNKLGLLLYNGDLIIESIVLPDRYIYSYGYYDEKKKVFIISSQFMKGNSKTKTNYIFADSPSNYIKEETIVQKKEEENYDEGPIPDGFAELTFLDNNYMNLPYRSWLKTKDLDGNCQITIKKEGPDSLTKKINFNIPFYKNITTRYKAIEFLNDYKLLVDQKTDDFLIYHTIIRRTDLHGMLLVAGNMKTEEVKTRFFDEAELTKYGITKKVLIPYSVSSPKFGDQTTYKLNDYWVINHKTRSGTHETIVRSEGKKEKIYITRSTASGQTIRNIFELSIDKDLEIVKVLKLIHPVNAIKNDILKMAPSKVNETYKNPSYKKQEFDFIYDQVGKIKPQEHIYYFFEKNGCSYIIDFKEENSAVELTKIKF